MTDQPQAASPVGGTHNPATVASFPVARPSVRFGTLWLVWPVLLCVGSILAGPYLGTAMLLKLTLWSTFAIGALSLSFVWGCAGVFSFGQTALFGIGGYAYAIMAVNFADATGETLTALLVGGGASAAAAALLGYVMFYGRIGDVYLAIVTVAFTLILYLMFSSTAGPEYSIGAAELGGFNGMPSLPTVTLPWPEGGGELGPAGLFVFAVCTAAACYTALRLIADSRFGLVLRGIRENEVRIDLLGYDMRLAKLVAFVVSGAVAGIGGGLFAAWGTFINPSVFSLSQAAMFVIWVMVGGRYSLAGAFLGVVLVQSVSDLADLVVSQQTPLLLGLMLVLCVRFLPEGLVPALGRVVWAFGARPSGGARAGIPQDVAANASHVPQSRAGRLEVFNLSKSFGGVGVLHEVTISFCGGSVHAIIGPNGAGKSTLFGTLVGQMAVSAGSVRLNDRDVTSLPTFRRARLGLGIKMQVPCLFGGLTVWDNVSLACRTAKSGAERDDRVWAALQRVGLEGRVGELGMLLSHGQQQWLELALIMAQDPEVILLDEPAAGLAPDERIRTVDLIRQLAAQHTVVVVEHDMAFVEALSAPVTMLYGGQIFRQGTIAELRADPEVVEVYLGGGLRASA